MGKRSRHQKTTRKISRAGEDSPPAHTPIPLERGRFSKSLLPFSLIAFVLALSVFSVRSDDLFMYLAAGEAIITTRSIPRIDPFLFSIPNPPWQIAHEWLAYIPIYLTYTYFGWNGLIALKCIPILLAALTPLWIARHLSRSASFAAVCSFLACLAACDRFIERTSLISDCLTAVTVALILVGRRGKVKAFWSLPLVFLLWANLHPGIIVGLVLVTFALAASFLDRSNPARSYRVALLLCLVTACLQPDGIGGVVYPVLKTLNENEWVVRSFYDEWKPTLSAGYIGSFGVQTFLVLLGLVGFLTVRAFKGAGGREEPLPFFELLAFTALAYHGLSAIRFLPTAAFGLAALGASLVRAGSQSSPGTVAGFRTETYVSFVLLLSAGYVALFGYSPLSGPRRIGLGFNPLYYPVQAGKLVDEIGLQTNVFNQHEYGNYLAWTWRPRRKIFFHGFVDDAVFYRDNYIAVTRSPQDFDRIVNQFAIGAFLLEGRSLSMPQQPLVYRELLTRPDWKLVYRDSASALFMRTIPENNAAFARLQELKLSRAPGL